MAAATRVVAVSVRSAIGTGCVSTGCPLRAYRAVRQTGRRDDASIVLDDGQGILQDRGVRGDKTGHVKGRCHPSHAASPDRSTAPFWSRQHVARSPSRPPLLRSVSLAGAGRQGEGESKSSPAYRRRHTPAGLPTGRYLPALFAAAGLGCCALHGAVPSRVMTDRDGQWGHPVNLIGASRRVSGQARPPSRANESRPSATRWR